MHMNQLYKLLEPIWYRKEEEDDDDVENEFKASKNKGLTKVEKSILKLKKMQEQLAAPIPALQHKNSVKPPQP